MSGTTLAKLYSSDAKFQFPYCAWEFKNETKDFFNDFVFQFPYCAWEFNQAIEHGLAHLFHVSIPILRVGVQRGHGLKIYELKRFQFPYCAWEFNEIQLDFDNRVIVVSIPILRVGVQLIKKFISISIVSFNSHTARGSSTVILMLQGIL